ncbi:MAG: PIN domain-containing protein [Acidobacteriota bacterium]|nr:PIN domain-containing protein [Acidobacteriota bacterium]
MRPKRLIDTNLIVRHLVQDQAAHGRIARNRFEASDRGGVTIILLPVVLAECVFVLESFYKFKRARIAAALGLLISSPGVQTDQAPIYLDALGRYRDSTLHFVDCVLAAAASAAKVPVATFDRGFRRFTDVSIDNS